MHPIVSLILPARNEAATIAEVVARADAALADRGWSREIVVVDSASEDATAEAAREAGVAIRVLREELPGKGRALNLGFREARGRVLAFLDADLDLAPEDVPRLVSGVLGGATCAAAMKAGPVLRRRPLQRRVGSRVVNLAARAILRTGLADHQTGMKAFQGAALRRVLPLVRETGWLWDLEVIWRLGRHRARFVQVPVQLAGCAGGHMERGADRLEAALETVRLIRRLRTEAGAARRVRGAAPLG